MNETEIRAKPIDPALTAAGCDLVEGSEQLFASRYRSVLPPRFPFPSNPHPLASLKIKLVPQTTPSPRAGRLSST
jgi:hypothetical protein